MGLSASVMIAEMENGERQILDRMDARLRRLDAWIEDTANPSLVELRAEVEITRISYEHQLAITRKVVEQVVNRDERNERVHHELIGELRALRRSLRGENGSN